MHHYFNLSVPKLPDKSQPFSYEEDNDNYIITNTRTLPASTQASFELTISPSPILPIKDVSSGYYSKPFFATVEVTTHENNIIKMKSNEIKAGLDTMAKITSTELHNSIIDYSQIPDELKPDKNIKDDYIYVKYTSFCHLKYSQDFKMTSDFNIKNTPESKDYITLGAERSYGYSQKNSEYFKNKNQNFENYIHVIKTDRYGNLPYTKYDTDITLFVAYPKKNLTENKIYTFGASVDYTLTSTDDKEVSKQTADTIVTYKNSVFQKPEWDGETYTKKETSDEYKYIDHLLKDKPVFIPFKTRSYIFGLNYTFNGKNPNNRSDYNKKEYQVESHDYKLEIENLGELNEDEYQFTKIRVNFNFPKYLTAKYNNQYSFYPGTFNKNSGLYGDWGLDLNNNRYENGDNKTSLLGYKNGEWIELAVFDYYKENESYKINIEPKNGASETYKGNNELNLPNGITQYKIKTKTKNDGVYIETGCDIEIKPTERIKNYIKSQYQENKKLHKSIVIVNHAKTNLIQDDIVKSTHKVACKKTLIGAQTHIRLIKGGLVNPDIKRQNVKLFYKLEHKRLLMDQWNENQNILNDINTLIERKVIIPEKYITFYDLLPKGVIPNIKSITTDIDKKIKKIDLIENYKNSDRILLKVLVENLNKTDYKALETKLRFEAYYPFDAIDEYGKVLVNIAASESDLVFDTETGAYKSARPDKPDYYSFYNSTDKEKDIELMTNLNPNHDNKSFAYSSTKTDINVDRYSLTSLKKEVDVNNEGSYSNGLVNELPKNVKEGGVYTYRLKIKNPDNSKSENIILYDKLEDYTPTEDKKDYKDTQWKGELLNIDTSHVEKLNAKPVIYYSTKENIILDDTNNRSDNDLTKSEIWTTTKPTDKKITAIAIDLRKKKDDSDFVLEYNQKLYVDINMKAPILKGEDKDKYYDTELKDSEKESGLTGGAHAYNNAVSTLTSFAKETNTKSENLLIRNDYTKVGIKKNEIKAQKIWDDDEDRDRLRPNEIKINLIKNNETIKSIKLNKENKWFYNFGNQPALDENNKPVDYRVEEETIPNGYSQSTEYENIEDGTLFKIKNQHDVEKVKIKVKKIYDENVNYTPSVKIKILGDGQVVKKINLPEYSNWYTDFISLPKYNKGKEIKYEVKEDYIEDFIPEYSKDGDTVTIHNKYHPYGNLKISKTVINATDFDKNKSFNFKFVMKNKDSTSDDTLYDYEKSDGNQGKIKNGDTIKLKHNENITIKNIKNKNQYSITEIVDSGYRPEEETISGVIKSNTIQEANFKNTVVKINMPISGQKGISLGLSLGVLLTLTSALYYRSKNKI